MSPTWLRPAAVAVPLLVTTLTAALLTAPGALAATAVTTRLVAAPAAVVDPSGAVWAADAAYADGGQLTPAPSPVPGAQAGLFAAARSGVAGYHLPVTGQLDTVTLGLVAPPGTAAGTQVFDVLAEGQVVAAAVDAAAAVGPSRAYRVTFAVRVPDGVLDLTFRARTGAPSVANLKIVSNGPASPTATKPPRTVTPGSPEAYGAVGDGVTDDTAALQKAFDAATVGRPVVLTAGRTYAHSGVLHLRKRWLQVIGTGTLLATDEATSSVWIEADNVLVDGAVVRTAVTTRRWDAWEQMGIRIVGGSGVTLRSVTVDGAAAAGIYVGNGATRFLLDHVTVQNTRADGIHMTAGSNNGVVLAPTVRNSGDDGVAVVSYSQDGPACHDIRVVSPTVLGTAWGRGLSVVGGTRITETDVDVRDTSAAGVYVAVEGDPWYTTASQQVTVSGGSISGANTDTGVDHGAVLVMSGRRGVVPSAVTVRGLAITGTRPTASRNLGVITYGDVPNAVLFADIAITGGPRLAYQGNTPAGAFQLTGVTHDGVAVPTGG